MQTKPTIRICEIDPKNVYYPSADSWGVSALEYRTAVAQQCAFACLRDYGKVRIDNYQKFQKDLDDIVAESFKVCPGTFYANPRAAGDEFIKKKVARLAKRLEIEMEGVDDSTW